MSKLKPVTTNISPENYNRLQGFLSTYNKRTGEDLTMSAFVWKAIKYYVNYLLKSWKP